VDDFCFRPHLFHDHTAPIEAAKAASGTNRFTENGDKVVTSGGIHGLVANIQDGPTLTLKIADNVKIEVEKSAVSSVLRPANQRLSRTAFTHPQTPFDFDASIWTFLYGLLLLILFAVVLLYRQRAR
jgi:hypothetical protein